MKLRLLFSTIAVLAIALPTTVSAEPPAQIPIQAYLTQSDGTPLDGSQQITVEIFKAKTGGSAIFSTNKTVQVSAGSFTAYLGADKTLDLSIFDNNKDLWAEVTVGSDKLQPRLRIATAPYAANAGTADDAAKLGGKSASEYNYSAGTGLQKSGTTFSIDPTATQQRVTGTCGSGKAAYAINQDGTVKCRSVGASISAGAGLTMSGNTISVANKGVDGGMIADSVAGADLEWAGSGSSRSLHVGNNTISSSELVTNSVGSSEIRSGAVGKSEVSNGSLDHEEMAKPGCDSSTSFRQVPNAKCDAVMNEWLLPKCDAVAPGGLCESNGNCANAPNSNHCPGGYEVYLRMDW